jgi:hypothetical protein
MVSSGMLRRVALVRTDVSDELSAFFIRVTKIGELGTTLDVTSNQRTLRSNINTNTFLRSVRENLNSYMLNVSLNTSVSKLYIKIASYLYLQ